METIYNISCFTYALFGIYLRYIDYKRCYILLCIQSILSFLNDVMYLQVDNKIIKYIDRIYANIMFVLLPLVYIQYFHITLKIIILLCSNLAISGYCFIKAQYILQTYGITKKYMFFHTLWHISLPLGGYILCKL